MLNKILNTHIMEESIHLLRNGCHWKTSGLKHKLDLEEDKEQNTSEDQEMQVPT